MKYAALFLLFLLRKCAKSAKLCENSFLHLKTRKARKGLLGCLPIAWAKYSKIVSCCARKFFYCEKLLKVRNIAKTFFFFALGCLLGAWAKIAKIVSCFARNLFYNIEKLEKH